MTDTSTPSPPTAPPAVDDPTETAADRADDTVDLDAVARDLDAVQAALDRLNDGTYWTDEVTGEPLPDDVLESDPTARTATGA